MVTNDGRVLLYAEKEKIAAVLDVDAFKDFLSLRNDAGTETIRVNRETGTIQSSIGDFQLLTADTVQVQTMTAHIINANTIRFSNGLEVAESGDELVISKDSDKIVSIDPNSITNEY